jgi:gliding motility-associated-like protein
VLVIKFKNILMKKIYLLSLFIYSILFSTSSYSQIQILTPNDTTICNGANALLRAQIVGRTGITLTLNVDDDYSGVIPIGFPFKFYGITYTYCLISSNGFISFDTTKANAYSQWNLQTNPGRIPGNPNCLNSFCGVYSDIYPAIGGVIDYSTNGIAPNRRFIVNFCSVPMYSCTTQLITFQMILDETTNYCEVHTGHKDTCVQWNGGYAIQGVQDSMGVHATVTPGRNDSMKWVANSDAYEFRPVLPNAFTYTVIPIPYAPVPNAGAPLYWFQGSTYLGTGNTLPVSPTVTTTYTIKAVNCGDTINTDINSNVASLTIIIGGGPSVSGETTITPSYCGGCDGKIVLHGLIPGQQDTVIYRKNGISQPYQIIPALADSTVTIINLCAGKYDSIEVIAGICHSVPVGPVFLQDPPVKAQFTYSIHYGCTADTVLFTNQSSTTGAPLGYRWQFGDNTSDTAVSPVHIFLKQGTYNVKLTAETNFCGDTTSKNVSLVHPIKAGFTVSTDTICQNQSITFTNTSVGTNPTYTWSFNNLTSDTSSATNPTETFLHAGVFRVKLLERDFVPCYDSAYMTVQVDSVSFLKLTHTDSTLCQGKAVTFTGSYLNYGYLSNAWDFGDGTVITNRNPISHAYEYPGSYAVSLTTRFNVCPDSTIKTNIVVSPYPVVNVGSDTSLCPGSDGLVITDVVNAGNNAARWLWNTGDTSSSITVTQPGVYYTTVTLNGCTTADSIWVKNDCYINIPNVFSPNGDGVNDYFFPRQILSSSVTTFSLTVYNRWGQEIFNTASISGRGWDGKYGGTDQPEGVYIYIINVSFKDGHSEHHQGNVTLLR